MNTYRTTKPATGVTFGVSTPELDPHTCGGLNKNVLSTSTCEHTESFEPIHICQARKDS